MEENQSWKTRTLVVGAVVGALAGVFAAYMLIQGAEQKKERPKLSAGDGVKVGLGLLGLMRMIAELGKR